ncbi:MAG: 30S ribosomal protein S20, partial [Endomicrobium sp.]|nr:30S ribosomal protein S20 [Endomicrobium sp.]
MSKLKTGRHKSAIKEARKNIKRYKHNVAIKSRLKTSIKKIEKLVSNKEHNISLLKLQLSTTFSQLDKAA